MISDRQPFSPDLPNGKRILVAGQKSGVVTALDPDRGGEIVWQKRVGAGGTLGGVEWGVAADQSNVYVAVSDVRIAVAPLGTPGAQPFTFNPKIGLLYDSKTGGGLSAPKLEYGRRGLADPTSRLRRCRRDAAPRNRRR